MFNEPIFNIEMMRTVHHSSRLSVKVCYQIARTKRVVAREWWHVKLMGGVKASPTEDTRYTGQLAWKSPNPSLKLLIRVAARVLCNPHGMHIFWMSCLSQSFQCGRLAQECSATERIEQIDIYTALGARSISHLSGAKKKSILFLFNISAAPIA